MSAAAQSSAGWQTGFLAVLPAVTKHAEIQFRRLPPERRDDAIQEAIAAACVSYQILAAKGRLDVAHPGTLATFAVNHVRNGRHVGGHQEAAKDVLSSRCQRLHRVTVRSLPMRPSGAGCEGWRKVVLTDRKSKNIPEMACFRIDFGDWLTTRAPRDRRIINRLASGDRTQELADRFGVTAGRVSQLRRRYEREWGLFQGEERAA